MAPNLKKLSAIAFEVKNLKVSVKRDAVYTESAIREEPNYWDEDTTITKSTDLFAVNHLEDNLINASTVSNEPPSATNPQNDAYWTEAKATEPNNVQNDYYWSWSHEQTASDKYWS